MTDDPSDNVSKLPVRFKPPTPADRTLLHPHEVGQRECLHSAFVVDASHDAVSCKTCGEKLNPMWVLKQLTARDHRFIEAHHRYAEEMKRLDERQRTKCDNCGHMTRISFR